VTDHGVTYPTLMDLEGRASDDYGVRAFPTLALIDRKGNLRYLQSGFDEQAVTPLLARLLAE